MARPREFDRDAALKRAMSVFWAKGYAGTSTDDLLEAMSIGRQSMYGAFGDKRTLYVEALERYQQDSIMGHVDRLRSALNARPSSCKRRCRGYRSLRAPALASRRCGTSSCSPSK